MPELERNKQIARDFFVHLSSGDVDALMSLFDATYTCWTAGSLPFSGTHQREVIRAMVEGVTGVFPDGLKFSVRSMTAEEDRVSVEAESLGTHSSGQTYNQLYHYLFVIRGGKIMVAREYCGGGHITKFSDDLLLIDR